MVNPAAVLLLLVAALPAQQPDLAAAEQELLHMFDRPQGQVISQEQKEKLGAFLQCYAGQDLQHLSYAKALHLYLDRDYDGAVTALDGFFAQHHAIANAEHRTMAGRIYLNAVAQQARAPAPDMAKIARWGEGMTRLYQDTDMLLRMAKTIGPRVPDPVAFRVALANGVFQSDLSTAQKDAFLQGLYAAAADASAAPAAGARSVPLAPATAARVDASKVVQPGQSVETFAAEKILNRPAKFDLADYRGKVVVLDFFATWCPPCRASVPSIVALQQQHRAELQVIGVTRFYGRGMDFSAAGATPPDGGKTVSNLDHDQEIAVNAAFAKAFAVDYPLVFAGPDLARERFGVTVIPTLVVIGKDGKLVGTVVGGDDDAHRKLVAMVEQARK